MAENSKIKQIKIGSTTYDIEPASQAQGTAVTVVTSISGGGVNKTTKYLSKTTADAAPQSHTHSVTVSGTTGANSGTAVTAVTGVSADGSATVSKNAIKAVSLTASSTSTDGPKYVESISGGSAISPTKRYAKFTAGTTPVSSASFTGSAVTSGGNSGTAVAAVTGVSADGTATVSTNAIKAVSLTASGTSTDGPAYIQDVSHTAASLTGTKTFNTDAIKAVSLSASSTSTDGPAYIESISGGSAVSKTTKYAKFTAGTTPVSSASFTGSAVTSGNNSGSAVAAVTGYPNFSGGSLGGTKTFVTGVSVGSGSLKGYTTSDGSTEVTYSNSRIPYIAGSFSNGVLDLKTYYLAHTHTSASASGTGTVTFTAASLGTPTTSNAAPHTHTHSVTAAGSVSLTRGTAPSINWDTGTNTDTPYIAAVSGGSAVSATTKYMKVGTTAASTGTVGISGGSISKTTKYMKVSTTPADSETVLTGVKASGTANCAPSGHTHSVTAAGSVGLTRGTAPSMNWNTGTTTDALYIYDITGGSAVSATTKYMKVGTTAADSETVLTGVKASGTASVAPSGHTHSYGSSTALTTSGNSGTKVTALTGISSTTTSSGNIQYIEDVTHTNASVSGTASVIKSE